MAGTIVAGNISDGQNSATTESVVKGSAKAWVNFNGTGTVSIRAGYNVSSITDNGTGAYTVNFINTMPDMNYSSICYASGNEDVVTGGTTYSASTSMFSVKSFDSNGLQARDVTHFSCAFFR